MPEKNDDRLVVAGIKSIIVFLVLLGGLLLTVLWKELEIFANFLMK
jgi:hypothetical protein